MSNVIKADFPNFFDAGSYPPSETQPVTVRGNEVNWAEPPELLEPNRNIDTVLSRFALYGRDTTSQGDIPGIVKLAHRALRTRLVQNKYLRRDEAVAFDIPDDEIIELATYAVERMRIDRNITSLKGEFRRTGIRIANGTYAPRGEQTNE